MGCAKFVFWALMVLKLCEAHYSGPNNKLINGLETSGHIQGHPWPMPQSYKPTPTLVSLDTVNFNFMSIGLKCDLLTNAYKRYADIIFAQPQISSPKSKRKQKQTASLLNTLEVDCAGCQDRPNLASDESYTLVVASDRAFLSSNEVWGAIRGLETFSQLVYRQSTGEVVINATVITDFPRFKHRGVLLDTSRHFLKKEYILKNLDAMAQNKFNVFHWHIVDDQAFPYYSKSFPKMSQLGAYDANTHVYMPADVSEIVEYARQRGIRVVVEFDSPGHTASWGKGVSDLLTECYSNGKFNGKYGPVNPVLNSTLYFLEAFFQDVIHDFPDQYIFIGGDEVSFTCWESNPVIEEFMKEINFGKDYKKLLGYYIEWISGMLTYNNKSVIVWQEVADDGAKLLNDSIVNVWKGGDLWQLEMEKMTFKGYKAILSSCWYLNYIDYGSDWHKYYECDPQAFLGTNKQKELVLGGEAALWSEYVDDTNIISRLWPRAAVVAERLWSAASIKDVKAAESRLAEHRCRMVRRGFNAEEVIGPGYCDDEY